MGHTYYSDLLLPTKPGIRNPAAWEEGVNVTEEPGDNRKAEERPCGRRSEWLQRPLTEAGSRRRREEGRGSRRARESEEGSDQTSDSPVGTRPRPPGREEPGAAERAGVGAKTGSCPARYRPGPTRPGACGGCVPVTPHPAPAPHRPAPHPWERCTRSLICETHRRAELVLAPERRSAA